MLYYKRSDKSGIAYSRTTMKNTTIQGGNKYEIIKMFSLWKHRRNG